MDRLDDISRRILDLLQQDGRISIADLAQHVELSAPTVQRRVKLLEEAGYIQRYTAVLDPLKLQLTVTAFVFVETVAGADLEEIGRWMAQLQGVQEVHNLIGEWCFLLKVRTQSPQTLEELIYRHLRKHPGMRRTLTTMATSSPYETTYLPLPELPRTEGTDR